jgi:hypothetical protein
MALKVRAGYCHPNLNADQVDFEVYITVAERKDCMEFSHRLNEMSHF